MGSLQHRLWECPAQLEVCDEEGVSAAQLARIRQEARVASARGEATAFNRCLAPAVRGPTRSIQGGTSLWRLLPPDGPYLDRYVFVDAAEVGDAADA